MDITNKTETPHVEEKTILRYSSERDSKGNAQHLELETTTVDIPEYTDKETRRILWKVDCRLLPMLAFFYLLAFLDRGNIGNAKVAGMAKDLHLVGNQYNVALTMFFIPYALLEVPCNIIMKMTRPSVWLAGLMFAWGIVMTLMGIVQSYGGLIAARWFLGVAESGFFPGAAFLLTLFYRRYEVLSRLAVFYSCASLSGAFSGLLAFALEKMDGIGGLEGWRWIFIIEGFLPILASAMSFFLVPDNPETCKFLTQPERDHLVHRLQIETGSGKGRVTNADKLTKALVWAGLKEWKTWAAVVMFWGASTAVYAFTYTIPTVILELGYTAAIAQLMTIPVYIFAMIVVIVWALISDHYGVRSTFIVIGFSSAVIGLVALLAIPHPKFPGLTYFFLFLTAAGIYCPQQLIVSWTANNSSPSSKRAVAMALLLSIGNLSGIVGSNIFVAWEAPRYWAGYGTCLGLILAAQCMAVFLRFTYARINHERDLMTEEEIKAKYTEAELLDLGDLSPYFRYTL